MDDFITADLVEFQKGTSSQSHNKRAAELYSICRDNPNHIINGITAEERSRIPNFPIIEELNIQTSNNEMQIKLVFKCFGLYLFQLDGIGHQTTMNLMTALKNVIVVLIYFNLSGLYLMEMEFGFLIIFYNFIIFIIILGILV